MPSHRLANFNLSDLEITGYSVAGEETVIAVPMLDVCFDIGKGPEQVLPVNNILLSHCHMDHAAGIVYYLSHRNFCGQAPGTVILPAHQAKLLREILDLWGRLDGNYIPANIIGVKPGDEIKIKPNIIARVFDTRHGYGSVGFSVIEIRKKLKQEFIGLSGPEIVNLKKQGIEIEDIIELPLVTYLGDTGLADYWKHDYIRNSRIIICECTFFVDEHVDKALAGKHMHVDQLVSLLRKMDNEHIIINHLTQRTSMREAINILSDRLPDEMIDRITILMGSRYVHGTNIESDG